MSDRRAEIYAECPDCGAAMMVVPDGEQWRGSHCYEEIFDQDEVFEAETFEEAQRHVDYRRKPY